MQTSLVGRQDELAQLDHVLEEAHSGNPRTVLLAGEVGIGKSRLLREVIAHAEAAGFVTICGQGLRLSNELPLMPIATAVADIERRLRGDQLEHILANLPAYAVGDLALLWPRLGPATTDHGMAQEWRQQRLFTAIRDLLVRVSEQTPLLVTLEDLHWADPSTLDLLSFLLSSARDERMCIVATFRSDELPPTHPTALWRVHFAEHRNVLHMLLPSLDRSELNTLVETLTEERWSSADLAELYRRTAGNCLFAVHLVAAASQGIVDVALPQRLRDVLLARVRRTSNPAQQVLTVVSAAGRAMDGALLAATLPLLGPEIVRDATQELIDLQLLVAAKDNTSIATCHALLAEAVLSRSAPDALCNLHSLIATHLAGQPKPAAAEIAAHWRKAGIASHEQAWTLEAAGQARRVHAYADAARFFERVHELHETASSCAASETDVLLAAAECWTSSGRPDRALAAALDGLEVSARCETSPEVIAGLHIVASAALIYTSLESAVEHSAKAQSALEHRAPSRLKARAFSAHGGRLRLCGRIEESRQTLDDAIITARTVEARAEWADALCRLAMIELDTGGPDCARLLDEARRVADQSPPNDAELSRVALLVDVLRSDIALKAEQHRDAYRFATDGLARAHGTGLSESFGAGLLRCNAVEALVKLGDLNAAEILVHPYTLAPIASGTWLNHLACAVTDLVGGRLEQADARLSEIGRITQASGSLTFYRATAEMTVEVAIWTGRHQDAWRHGRTALDRLIDSKDDVYCGELCALVMRAAANRAEIARAQRNHPALASAIADCAELARLLQARPRVFAPHPYIAATLAAKTTFQAEHARASASPSTALWAEATQQWRTLGRRHSAAYCALRSAEAQLSDGAPTAAAAKVLHSAADWANGHRPLTAAMADTARRARIELDDDPATVRTPPDISPYDLTPRELSVLELLRAGSTNKQIGHRLFISSRTAGVHVSNIMRKLGVTSRVQAATIAERANLTGQQVDRSTH